MDDVPIVDSSTKGFSWKKFFIIMLLVLVVSVLVFVVVRIFDIPVGVSFGNVSDNVSIVNSSPIIPVIVNNSVSPSLSSVGCGDGVCGLNEVYSVCAQDCVVSCGDMIVQDSENWRNCRFDLMYKCGNGVCDEWEHYRYCSNDCAECIVDDKGTYQGVNKCPPSPRWV